MSELHNAVCEHGQLRRQCALCELTADVVRMKAALNKINDIRNSIIGCQGFNFSEHAYPLVAALNEAGIHGLPYPEAKKNLGTLIERNEQLIEVLKTTAGNLRSLIAATNCRTYDLWLEEVERAIAKAEGRLE